ncbi:tetratricopeptide repeat protein [Roseovarius aestuariivivens]|uniref:tetratricopeptide repeat protein n=1 Tax=Roseovarius aestuariivivens TaxID=1888910 RepID=UPI001FDA70EA|nr:tetratricopeptide repeat protein [Roseovarius aestuariivivens]
MTIRFLKAGAVTATLAATAIPATATEDVGAYLAARQASYANDFSAAARYLSEAITRDSSNPALLENAVIAYMALGDIDRAATVAQKIDAEGLQSQVAFMALIVEDIEAGNYDAVLERLEAGRGIGQLADGLTRAWVQLGRGDVDAALVAFDAVAEERGLRSFALYHKALALASVGDFEAAEAIFSGNGEAPLQRTRRGTIAWAEVLSQLERNDEAVAVLDDAFGTTLDPEIAALRAELESGLPVPFRLITGAKEGLAEVYYSIGQALLNDASEDYVLLYARMAEYLHPGHVDAIIMAAELLESLERYELAVETYKRVPRDHPSFAAAEMGRAESLRRAEKTDAAIEVLAQLRETNPDLPLVHVAAGDLYRQTEDFAAAVAAYDAALERYTALESDQWFVRYARAISHERQGNWQEAEADFRKALELNPGHPQVLNYLGYSLVEKQIKLDEALAMIEEAVERQPDSGYIVDSLGWVLYRLGRYDEAIGHMERAAELMPVDPVVNDHLGDVLWAVGRKTEARFQWKRALSFVDEDDPSPDIDPDRIRRKLEVGLDEVLAEEGAPPLKVADDDG